MRAIETLAHVTLAVDDLAQATADYEGLFESTATHAHDDAGRDVTMFQTGNIALHLRVPARDETPGLAALAFRVPDVARAQETLARCGLPGASGALDPKTTHGIPMRLVDARDAAQARSSIALDHIVIRTPAPERAVALYGGRLGLDMRLDRSNSAWNARLMFFRCGDLVVEIAHVLSAGVSDAPDTFGGFSWRVPDIEATHARLTAAGCTLSDIRTGRRPGSRVCTMRDRTGGVPTILLGVTARD